MRMQDSEWASWLNEAESHAIKDLWALDRASSSGNWSARYGTGIPESELTAGQETIAVFRAAGTSPDGDARHCADAGLAERAVTRLAVLARQDLRLTAAIRAILVMQEEQPGYDLPEGVHDGRDPDERNRDEALAGMLADVLHRLTGIQETR